MQIAEENKKQSTNSWELNGKSIIPVLAVVTLQYQKKMVDALMQLAFARMFAGWVSCGSTLLPMGRNKAISIALEQEPNFTHLVFIDDDMTNFTPEKIAKLIMNDKDICSALVTQRRPPYSIIANCELNDAEILDHIKNCNVIQSTFCGMACTVIKRHVLDAMRELTNGDPIWFTCDRISRDGWDEEKEEFLHLHSGHRHERYDDTREILEEAILFGQMHNVGSKFQGEDMTFCEKASKMGFEIWVDCGVSVGHLGEVEFDFRHSFAESYKENTNETNS